MPASAPTKAPKPNANTTDGAANHDQRSAYVEEGGGRGRRGKVAAAGPPWFPRQPRNRTKSGTGEEPQRRTSHKDSGGRAALTRAGNQSFSSTAREHCPSARQ